MRSDWTIPKLRSCDMRETIIKYNHGHYGCKHCCAEVSALTVILLPQVGSGLTIAVPNASSHGYRMCPEHVGCSQSQSAILAETPLFAQNGTEFPSFRSFVLGYFLDGKPYTTVERTFSSFAILKSVEYIPDH